MSRYDILLNNEPKKDPPPKEQTPPAPPSKPLTRASDEATRRPGDEPVIRPDDRSTGGRGELIRRGFEWYADQLRALKKLSLEEQLEGKPGSMSQMVREALDAYLQKRAAGK